MIDGVINKKNQQHYTKTKRNPTYNTTHRQSDFGASVRGCLIQCRYWPIYIVVLYLVLIKTTVSEKWYVNKMERLLLNQFCIQNLWNVNYENACLLRSRNRILCSELLAAFSVWIIYYLNWTILFHRYLRTGYSIWRRDLN